MLLYEKFNNSDKSFEDNKSQNDHLSSHITVSSILLCPVLYCVQHYTVSSTLMCPIHYYVQQNTVSRLTQRIFCSPFIHILSCCGRIMLRLRLLFCFLFVKFFFAEIGEVLLYVYTISSHLIITIQNSFLLFKVDVLGR